MLILFKTDYLNFILLDGLAYLTIRNNLCLHERDKRDKAIANIFITSKKIELQFNFAENP